MGDLKAAARDFDNAIEIEPQDIKAWASRGFAYERLAQLYQLARLNGDFCGLLAGKCESNQWGAMTKRL